MAGGDTQGELVQDLVYYKASLRLAFKHPMCFEVFTFSNYNSCVMIYFEASLAHIS